MKIRNLACITAIALLVSIACSGQVKAISILDIQDDPTTVPSTSMGFQTAHFGAGFVEGPSPPNTSQTNVFLSPWFGTPYDFTYTSVRNGSAGYNLTGNRLNLFWGSPDSWNTLTFYTGLNGTGASTTPLVGSSLLDPDGSGHHLVSILTDVVFRSVILTSGQPAFEFANLTATPIPAALPLFATGLGVMGWLARRKKRLLARIN